MSTKVEKLARILCQIHGHCHPFYGGDGKSITEDENGNVVDEYSWEALPDKTGNKDEVDRSFFLSMAEDVLKSIK